jgi:hypothetical protein
LNRTQEIALFCTNRVQSIMFNTLFVWANEEGTEAAGRYRQGMNELLSPLVLVLLRECQTRDGWSGAPSPTPASTASSTAGAGAGNSNLDSLLPVVLDSEFVEHDIYALLVRLLEPMAAFFAKTDAAAAAKALAAKRRANAIGLTGGYGPGGAPEPEVEQTPMVRKCHYIHHILLATLDPQLYAHLNRQEVQPTLYVLRWFRLLFSREFHLEDTLLIWDVLFATHEKPTTPGTASTAATSPPAATLPGLPAGPTAAPSDSSSSGGLIGTAANPVGAIPSSGSTTVTSNSSRGLHASSPYSAAQNGQGFLLAEYLCVAMLQYVRVALLQGDNSYCLRRLLRYPPVEDVRVLLARALHFSSGWKGSGSGPDNKNSLSDHLDESRGIVYAAEGTLESFQGSYDHVTGGMGADAPLEDGSSSGGLTPHNLANTGRSSSTGANVRKPQQQQQRRGGDYSGSGSGGAGGGGGGGLIAGIKSFVKGAVAKAGEIPHLANAAAGGNGSPRSGSYQHAGAGKPKYNSATLAPNARKTGAGLPSTSGVSHFLSPSGSSPSPPAGNALSAPPNVSPPPPVLSPAVHDELVLLRKELAVARREAATSTEAARAAVELMALAADMQSKLGQIMAIEVARVQRAAGVADHANELQVKLQPATDGDLISVAIMPNASAEVGTPSVVSPVPVAQVATLQGSLTQLRLISDVLVGRVQMGDALDRLTPSLAQLAHPPSSSSSSGVVSPAETAADSTSNHSHTETAELEQQVSLVSQMRALHARQQSALTASNTSASSDAGAPSNTSGGAGGLAFPYNIPASSAAKKPATSAEELFEAPKPSRDRVSELFALDDDDPIISPTYKTNNKTSIAATPSSSPTAATANKMADPLLSPNVKRPAATSSTSAAVASTPSTGAAGAIAAASLTSPVTPATAAAAAAPSPSAAASSLLSTLLSAPGSGQQLRRASKSLFSSSGGSGASSAFGGDDELAAKGLSAFESPIGSPAGMGLFAPVPPPAGLSDGGLFGSDGPLVGLSASSSRTGRVRQGAVSASGRGGAGGLGFGLEDDDDMILLPSAAAFRDKPKTVATTTTNTATKVATTTATAATAAALSAAAPVAASAKPAAAAPKAATPASSAAAPAATGSKPKPVVAKARDLFDADDDPLSWMGTGKK